MLLRLATTSGEGLLKRRQDLPEEAFFVPSEELLAKLSGPSYQKYFFMALSYRWLTESPFGWKQLANRTISLKP